jgi:4-coumarate--CoA ligase
MVKYLNRPKETAEYFDNEGFGHTGDLGYYTEDGEIFFVDRIKELIK